MREEPSVQIDVQRYLATLSLQERRRKLYVVFSAIPGAFAFVLIVVLSLNHAPWLEVGEYRISLSFLTLLVAGLLLASLTGFIVSYLQTGLKASTALGSLKRETSGDDVPFEAVAADVHADGASTAADDAVAWIATSRPYTRRKPPRKHDGPWPMELVPRLDDAEYQADLTLNRLQEELDALGRRNNINLGIGIAITLLGVGALFFFVARLPVIDATKPWAILNFVPRLSLVILIEIFAYFFLSPYRSGLADVKYFQNEMTTAEAKVTALRASLATKDTTAIARTIQRLAETDRNVASGVASADDTSRQNDLLKSLDHALELAKKLTPSG